MRIVRTNIDESFKRMMDNVKDNINSKYKNPNGKRPAISNGKLTHFLSKEINQKELEKKLIEFFKL